VGQGNYCAVLIDLDKAKPIGILRERTQSYVREVLSQWGTEILEQIEEVSYATPSFQLHLILVEKYPDCRFDHLVLQVVTPTLPCRSHNRAITVMASGSTGLDR